MDIWKENYQIIIVPKNVEFAPHWTYKWREFSRQLTDYRQNRFFIRINKKSYYTYDLAELNPNWTVPIDINQQYKRIEIYESRTVNCYCTNNQFSSYGGYGEYQDDTIRRILYEGLDDSNITS